jgi:hypothetical protein
MAPDSPTCAGPVESVRLAEAIVAAAVLARGGVGREVGTHLVAQSACRRAARSASISTISASVMANPTSHLGSIPK